MKKILVGLVLLTSFLTLSASAKVFSVKKTSTQTQYPCPFSTGGCFEDDLEILANDKCYSAGYDRCVTIEKKTSYDNGGRGICGNYSKWHCTVRVRGTND